MAPATIALEVDPDTARAFAAASAEDRRKLQLLLRLRLRELTVRPTRTLKYNLTFSSRGKKADSNSNQK